MVSEILNHEIIDSGFWKWCPESGKLRTTRHAMPDGFVCGGLRRFEHVSPCFHTNQYD